MVTEQKVSQFQCAKDVLPFAPSDNISPSSNETIILSPLDFHAARAIGFSVAREYAIVHALKEFWVQG